MKTKEEFLKWVGDGFYSYEEIYDYLAVEFPSEEEMHEERRRFHREIGKQCGVSEKQIENQIDSIGRIPWMACYTWLKKRAGES